MVESLPAGGASVHLLGSKLYQPIPRDPTIRFIRRGIIQGFVVLSERGVMVATDHGFIGRSYVLVHSARRSRPTRR